MKGEIAQWLSKEYGCTVKAIIITPGTKQPSGEVSGWFTIGYDWLKKRAETNNELMDILVRGEI